MYTYRWYPYPIYLHFHNHIYSYLTSTLISYAQVWCSDATAGVIWLSLHVWNPSPPRSGFWWLQCTKELTVMVFRSWLIHRTPGYGRIFEICIIPVRCFDLFWEIFQAQLTLAFGVWWSFKWLMIRKSALGKPSRKVMILLDWACHSGPTQFCVF